jgi:hypothetical protein
VSTTRTGGLVEPDEVEHTAGMTRGRRHDGDPPTVRIRVLAGMHNRRHDGTVDEERFAQVDDDARDGPVEAAQRLRQPG